MQDLGSITGKSQFLSQLNLGLRDSFHQGVKGVQILNSGVDANPEEWEHQ